MMAKLANAVPSPSREMLALSRNELWSWIRREYPVFANLQIADELPDGARVNLARGTEKLFSSSCGQIRSGKDSQGNSGLELQMVDWTFGTEELSGYSKFIHQVEKQPCLFMNPKDASGIGVKDKERITLSLDRGRLEVELRIVDNMATGVIVMPHHRQLAWQKIEKWPAMIAVDQIRK